MPERWQDELKKLRREEMPDGVRERAEGGPRRELPNDGRQRVVAGVVAFAVFIAAGAFAWRAFDSGDSHDSAQASPSDIPTAVVTLLASDPTYPDTPSANIVFEGDRVHGQPLSFSWENGIYDTFAPEFKHPLVLPNGTRMRVEGDADSVEAATIRGTELGKADHFDIGPSTFALVLRPGVYFLQFTATWSQGTVTFLFPIEILPSPETGPAVLHLTCTPDRAIVDKPTVQAQADGIHIQVDAHPDITGAEIITGSNPEDFAGVGLDPQSDGSRGIAIAPGSWSVGCYTPDTGGFGPSDIGSPRVAPFTVIDPDGLYADPVLGCASTTTTTFNVTGSVPGSDQTWETMIADTAGAIPGILPTDTVRDAGYPDGPGFKDGPHPVVVRDGTVIATLQFYELEASGGAWSATMESCTGSGLGEGVVSEPTAASDPDVAVVRCTDGVAEVETPTVRPQLDGVHILVKAPGAGDELGVIFESTIDRSAYLSGSQDPTNGIVREMGAGTWRVACYSGPGEPDGVAGDAPSLVVVDPDGMWIPTTLQCTGQESGISMTQEFTASAQDAIHAVTGVLPTDVVEPAGYSEGSSAVLVWRVVRDGSVVAWLHLRQAGDEWWVIAGMGCTDAGIGVPHSMPTPA